MKIWKNRKQIIEGIKNNTFKNEHIEQISELRNNICLECKFYDKIGTKCEMKGTAPCCGDCGCSLKFKTRALSTECPQGKWSALLTEEEEDSFLG